MREWEGKVAKRKGNSEIAMGLRNVTLPHKTYRYWRYYV